MASGDIVPIQLGLTEGDLTTLWAPLWREGDDEWQAFLGEGDDVYGFESVAALAAFVRTNSTNDLVEHPEWPIIARLSASEFVPDSEHTHDLIAVVELAAEPPTEESVVALAATLRVVQSLGEVCELESVTGFFDSHPVLSTVETASFEGRDGRAVWDKIGTAIAQGWDDVIDAVDAAFTTPPVDDTAVAVAEAELLAAQENEVDVDDATDDDDEFEDAPEDLTLWAQVGIDPIQIVTSVDTWYTLRCYLGDRPIFLGKNSSIFVFSSPRSLARYLADDHDTELSRVSTYETVQTAAIDGSLEVEVTDDNVYVLTGLTDDVAAGPRTVDREQLELTVELLLDAAEFVGDGSVEPALASAAPLGWLVSYVLDDDRSRLAPSAPFDVESQALRALIAEFEARLVQR